jgi:LEA14-like dessication related protein
MRVWACAVTLAVLAGCATTPKMEPLGVTLSDIVPAQMGILEQQFQVKLRVQNPNNFDIPLEGVSYRIDLNGKPFAKGVGKQSVTIPKFGEEVLDVTAVSGLSGVLAQFAQLQKGPPEKLSYRVKGTLFRTDGSSIPFDQVGEVDLAGLSGGSQ